jgi:hypothetical protein
MITSPAATLPVAEALVQADRRVATGRIVSAIPTLFLVFDAAIKLVQIAPVTEAMQHLGYPVQLAPMIGLLELACLALHLIPRTSIAGLLLLTGFLGGAVASHVRVGDPLLTHVLFPIYIAAMLWGGSFLRDGKVRALFARTTNARTK